MTEIDFEPIEGEYGEEVALRFDYDETLTERIKRLKEDRHWGVTHLTAEWSDDDEFLYWSIDRTEESLERFQEVVGYPVPDGVWPGSGERGGDDVEIVVPEGQTRAYVHGAGDELDNALDLALSYDNPDAEHSAMAPERIRLYDASRRRASMGLAGRMAETAEALGHDAEIRIEGDRSGRDIDTDWLFPHDLRDYQEDAVDAVLDSGGGIVGLPTGAGKTVTALRAIDLIGQDAIIFVHTKELLHQWADEIRGALGVEPGVIGDGAWSTGPVTVCTMQTLMSRGIHELGDPGVIVFDECHRTSAADTMHEIGMSLDADYRIGLSATPWRRISGAEMKIEGAVGGTAYEIGAEELIERGYLAEPEFEVLTHGGPMPERGEEYHEAYARCIEGSDERNAAIAREAGRLADEGRRVLVNVDRVDQGAGLAGRIGDGAAFLSGSDPTSRREEVLGDFESGGGVSVLVSTLIKEGVDIPAMDAVILAHAGRSDISTLQVIGRALRPDDGADGAVICDVRDRGKFFGAAFEERQETMAEYYGRFGPGGDADGEAGEKAEPSGSLAEPLSDEEEAEMEDWLAGE